MSSLRRVLIANRGEIAIRIIRACKELDLETVQAYSEADRDSLPVRMADRSVCIGPVQPAKSYLNQRALISAALVSGCDAIHPGYGFLAENAQFSDLCDHEGVVFIGPKADVIRLMGDKSAARELATEAKVAVTPGSTGTVSNYEEVVNIAEEIGYPLLLKAAAGGGGRGMRIVSESDDLEAAFQSARGEAEATFSDSALYVERYLTDIRHIEVQILGDGKDVIHFGERDCSIQRRHQKLVEESPSPAISDSQRTEIFEASVRLARQVGYQSVGTLEFIFDTTTERFYFIEMNTRIQVEHPVTEMVTGIDLIKEQIRIASGEPLSRSQAEISFSGHAVECRINAEDPTKDFMPTPGTIQSFAVPGGPGVRVDTHACHGYRVPPYYDSLIAKVICWGQTREESISRMRRALDEFVIGGFPTTLEFHTHLMSHPQFANGDVNTEFVQDTMLDRTPLTKEESRI